jgi:4-diphosphocytidyl-2-C-methyl-D-erythritol kinase
MPARAVQLRAPAKINLFLEVKNRRPDGYHNIDTVFQTVSLFDRLTFRPHPTDLLLTCSRPDLPVDERNLAMRAAITLRAAAGTRKGARLGLEKNIPLGAGLGGGSSDAAAVLTGLARLWNLRISKKELVRIAAGLGADVPFFLEGGTALASGIGDRIEQLPSLQPSWFILIYPGFPVSTPWVYKNLRFPLTNKQKIITMRHHLQARAMPAQWSECLFNRLEDVVLPEHTLIRRIKGFLQKKGLRSLMSGSGSTIFGLLTSRGEGECIKAEIEKKHNWGVWVVKSVS